MKKHYIAEYLNVGEALRGPEHLLRHAEQHRDEDGLGEAAASFPESIKKC